MSVWSMWLATLEESLQFLSLEVGLGAGLAIVVLTLLLRLVLLPVSWSCAYRGSIHQKRIRKLQPELKRIREQFQATPEVLIEQTMKAYRRHGVSPFEGRVLLGALAQMPVLLGVFQVLRTGMENLRFLWVANIARPDFWFAVIAAVTTATMMAANPDLPEQTRMLMIVLPSILAFVFALKFSSALALYWIVSNCFTAIQTDAVHFVVEHRVRAGTLRI